jgi:hypothetical protein
MYQISDEKLRQVWSEVLEDIKSSEGDNAIKTWFSKLEVFRFDMIPGRDKLARPIKVRSRTKASGAFIFAKYSTPGKFMESIGRARKVVVRFKPNKWEVLSGTNLNELKEKMNLKGGLADYVSNIG